MTAIEITGSNGEVHFENMSGIGGTIKEGNYIITNGTFAGKTSGGNNPKKFTTIYQSSSDIKRNNKLLKLPGVSKKNIKKQIIIKNIEKEIKNIKQGKLELNVEKNEKVKTVKEISKTEENKIKNIPQKEKESPKIKKPLSPKQKIKEQLSESVDKRENKIIKKSKTEKKINKEEKPEENDEKKVRKKSYPQKSKNRAESIKKENGKKLPLQRRIIKEVMKKIKKLEIKKILNILKI